MKIKCSYCGSTLNDTDSQCPNCGAPNDFVKKMASGIPQTIEQLQKWYVAHNLPDEEVTRFFIGKDYKKPRAFGIYRDDNGDVVVYKNKNDGSRAIRYRGKDEAYAVNEIYMKLKEEIANQKARINAGVTRPVSNNRKGAAIGTIIFTIIVFIVIAGVLMAIFSGPSGPSSGYYTYNNHHYYNQGGDWYYYDNYDRWTPVYDLDQDFVDNYDEYYESHYYNPSENVDDFENSPYYDLEKDTDWGSSDSDSHWNDNDSWDSDWDSGSWDFGGGSWDSDW